MSQTLAVTYRDRSIWAYDVALAIFLKHVIDAALPRASSGDSDWLASAIPWWRVVASISCDYGLEIDQNWTAEQIDIFVSLCNEACAAIGCRPAIPAIEVEAWQVLGDTRIFARSGNEGANEIATFRVVELGHAIVDLVRGTLPPPPPRTWWYFGCPLGKKTISMRE